MVEMNDAVETTSYQGNSYRFIATTEAPMEACRGVLGQGSLKSCDRTLTYTSTTRLAVGAAGIGKTLKRRGYIWTVLEQSLGRSPAM